MISMEERQLRRKLGGDSECKTLEKAACSNKPELGSRVYHRILGVGARASSILCILQYTNSEGFLKYA